MNITVMFLEGVLFVEVLFHSNDTGREISGLEYSMSSYINFMGHCDRRAISLSAINHCPRHQQLSLWGYTAYAQLSPHTLRNCASVTLSLERLEPGQAVIFTSHRVHLRIRIHLRGFLQLMTDTTSPNQPETSKRPLQLRLPILMSVGHDQGW